MLNQSLAMPFGSILHRHKQRRHCQRSLSSCRRSQHPQAGQGGGLSGFSVRISECLPGEFGVRLVCRRWFSAGAGGCLRNVSDEVVIHEKLQRTIEFVGRINSPPDLLMNVAFREHSHVVALDRVNDVLGESD